MTAHDCPALAPTRSDFDRFEEAGRDEAHRARPPYRGPVADHPLDWACCDLQVRAHEGWGA